MCRSIVNRPQRMHTSSILIDGNKKEEKEKGRERGK